MNNESSIEVVVKSFLCDSEYGKLFSQELRLSLPYRSPCPRKSFQPPAGSDTAVGNQK